MNLEAFAKLFDNNVHITDFSKTRDFGEPTKILIKSRLSPDVALDIINKNLPIMYIIEYIQDESVTGVVYKIADK